MPSAFEVLRRLRLIARLAQRPPDERVGTSLFVFRLSDEQVAEATSAMNARVRGGFLGALALLLAVGWAFAPILGNGLVWDDGANLIAARASWDQGLRGVAWAFSQPFNGRSSRLPGCPISWTAGSRVPRPGGCTRRSCCCTCW